MFGFQRGELCFQSFDVEIHGHARRVRRYNNTTDAPGTIRPERCRNTAVSCSSSKRIGTFFCPSEPTDGPDLALERRMWSPCRLSGVLKAARPALPLHRTDVLRFFLGGKN